MNLSPFGYPNRRETVVIVGAGATRGASFVAPHQLAKPPVDADFFTILRRTSFNARDLDDTRAKLLDFLSSEFGSYDVGMETFYSQAYLHNQFVGDIPKGTKGRIQKYAVNLRRFERLIPVLLGRSLRGQTCLHHDALVSVADAKDVFVSFNYDCILDHSVMNVAKRNWRPEIGYGFPIAAGLAEWRNHDGPGRPPTTGVRVLKPHGSLNWERTQTGVGLIKDAYEERAPGTLLIVPPLWQKDYSEEPFRSIWSQARRALSSTKALFIVGYSLPVYTQAMLRIDVGHLDFLCIVNPDDAARARILSVLKSAISSSTHLVEVRDVAHLNMMIGANSR